MNLFEEYTEHTKLFNKYVSVLKSRSDKDKLLELSESRKLSLDVINRHDIFYIKDMAEILVPEYLKHLKNFGVISNTNNKPIFHNRWIIPIKDSSGNIINLVGYSPDFHERYVYGTAKYYRRNDDMYGLENTHKAYECGYFIITEGITDALAMRDIGYDMTMGMCGTSGSDHKMTVLNRARYGVIKIHDRDKAGDKTKLVWVPNRSFDFITPIMFKDSSETLSSGEEYKEWLKGCMQIAIDWIKESEHKGRKCNCGSATMC